MFRDRSLLFLVCLAVAPQTQAQAPAGRITLPGESAGTGRRLAAADQLAAAGQWTEALDEYQHVLDEAGDDLVPLDARHSIEARRLCHLRLAAMPAGPLRLYRSREKCCRWLDLSVPIEGTPTRIAVHATAGKRQAALSARTSLGQDFNNR